jgi:hypothetical protein
MVAITAQFAKGMVLDMYKYSMEAEQYDPTPEQSDKIFRKIDKPGGAYYQSTSVIGMDELQETSELEGFTFRSPTEGYTVLARPFDFTDAVSFSKNAVSDCAKMKDLGKQTSKTWGGAKKTTKEKFYASFFNNGGLTAGYSRFNGSVVGVITDASGNLCYDSIEAFNLSNNTRSSKKGGTYYNSAAISLSHSNAITLYNLYTDTNAYDENDERISNIPDYIWYPPALRFTADTILQSTLIPNSMNNDKNVLQSIVEPLMWSFLTDTDAWGYGKKLKGWFGCMWQDLVYDFFEDKTGRQICYTAEMRLLGGMDNWRFTSAANVSAS